MYPVFSLPHLSVPYAEFTLDASSVQRHWFEGSSFMSKYTFQMLLTLNIVLPQATKPSEVKCMKVLDANLIAA